MFVILCFFMFLFKYQNMILCFYSKIYVLTTVCRTNNFIVHNDVQGEHHSGMLIENLYDSDKWPFDIDCSLPYDSTTNYTFSWTVRCTLHYIFYCFRVLRPMVINVVQYVQRRSSSALCDVHNCRCSASVTNKVKTCSFLHEVAQCCSQSQHTGIGMWMWLV